MVAPTVTIGRLLTHLRAADAESAYTTARLVDDAAQRLGPSLEAALPGALAAAGLDEAAMLAIPHIALRLRIEGNAPSAEEIGAAWAKALARAIAAAVPATQGLTPSSSVRDAPVPALFDSDWAAEAALLLAAARGEAAPWWAAAAQLDLTRPGAEAVLLITWIGRDPARAAQRMTALLTATPDVATLLSAAEAGAVSDRLIAALREAIAPASMALSAVALNPVDRSAAVPLLLARLPAGLRSNLASLPPALRAPWIAAAVMAHRPSWTMILPDLLPALRDRAAEAWRGGMRVGTEAAAREAAPNGGPEASCTEASPLHEAVPDDRVRVDEVSCGGLLLLLRPIAALAPEWLMLGDALADRLLALGLLVLRRLAGPLSPAARRAALERDRPLLAVFAGVPPPEGPLDEAVDANLEIEALFARLLAAAPAGIEPMPGALRRVYGDRDPFARDLAAGALCRLILRPGRLRSDAVMAELVWPHDAADLALRRAGWDQDPGWLPWIGRRITFRFEDGA